MKAAPPEATEREARAAARPARVLIMSENMPCPPDRRVYAEATSLARRGYTVSVVCPRGAGQAMREVDASGVHFFRYPQPPSGDGLAGYAVEYGLSLIHAFRLMLRIAVSPGFDVLQGCNPPDLFFVLGLTAGLFGKRYIFDQHDLSPELYRSRFTRPGARTLRVLEVLERLSYRTADAVLVTNESYRRTALKRGGISAEKVFVVRNGPRDGWPIRTDPQQGLKQGKAFLALYAGVMGPQDGVLDFLHAARHVASQRDDVLFALLGDGDERPKLEAAARELGLEDRVRFVGWVADERVMAAYLATADVCVSPEPSSPLNDVSSFVKIVEYMAVGKPIVAYDLPETRITAGDAALYAPSGDAAALGERVLDVLRDPAVAKTMKAEAAARMPGLVWERQEGILAEAYAFALSGCPAAAVEEAPVGVHEHEHARAEVTDWGPAGESIARGESG